MESLAGDETITCSRSRNHSALVPPGHNDTLQNSRQKQAGLQPVFGFQCSVFSYPVRSGIPTAGASRLFTGLLMSAPPGLKRFQPSRRFYRARSASCMTVPGGPGCCRPLTLNAAVSNPDSLRFSGKETGATMRPRRLEGFPLSSINPVLRPRGSSTRAPRVGVPPASRGGGHPEIIFAPKAHLSYNVVAAKARPECQARTLARPDHRLGVLTGMSSTSGEKLGVQINAQQSSVATHTDLLCC